LKKSTEEEKGKGNLQANIPVNIPIEPVNIPASVSEPKIEKEKISEILAKPEETVVTEPLSPHRKHRLEKSGSRMRRGDKRNDKDVITILNNVLDKWKSSVSRTEEEKLQESVTYIRRRLKQARKDSTHLKQQETEYQKKLDTITICSFCGHKHNLLTPTTTIVTEGVDIDKILERYDLQQVIKAQRIVRSWLMRKRFFKLATDFKKNKASLVLRLRNEVLREIASTERTYVRSLEAVIKEYILPLEDMALTNKKILTKQDCYDIFCNMEILVDLNNQFLEDFEDRLKKWPTITHFGDLFIKIIPIMKIYSHYIRNYDRAAELLATLKKENETLQEFIKIQETKPIMGNLTLESHLIMPVQRLPRYQLLLDTLLKYTPEEHVDHQNLIKALEKTREVINTINQKKER